MHNSNITPSDEVLASPFSESIQTAPASSSPIPRSVTFHKFTLVDHEDTHTLDLSSTPKSQSHEPFSNVFLETQPENANMDNYPIKHRPLQRANTTPSLISQPQTPMSRLPSLVSISNLLFFETPRLSNSQQISANLAFQYPPSVLAKSILIIILIPLVSMLTFLLLPYQEPQTGIKYNYVFLIGASFNLLCSLWIYMFWSKVFTTYTFHSPIIVSVVSATCVYIIVAAIRMPLKGMVLLGTVVISFTYPLMIVFKGKSVQAGPEYFVKAKLFTKLRFGYAAIVLTSWAYIILFFALPAFQLIYSIFYALFMFVLKYTLIIFTHRHTAPEFHGLAAFWIEFFHSFFVSLAFCKIEQWYVILVILLIQLSTYVSVGVALVDRWWDIATRLLAWYSPDKDRINPGREEYTRNLLKISMLCIFAHMVIPFYYIPAIYFCRYGWTKNFFPYAALSQQAFNTSILLMASSFAIAVIGGLCIIYAVHRTNTQRTFPQSPSTSPVLQHISLYDIMAPLIIENREFFCSAIMSGLCPALATVLYQSQLYYAFAERTPVT